MLAQSKGREWKAGSMDPRVRPAPLASGAAADSGRKINSRRTGSGTAASRGDRWGTHGAGHYAVDGS